MMRSIPAYNPSDQPLPPFSFVRLVGDPIQRGHRIAWTVRPAADHADDADPSRLAVVGAQPIAARGYGSVSQVCPQRISTDVELAVGLPLGPSADSSGGRLGGEYMSLGTDTITLPDLDHPLTWAVPGDRLGAPVWCQGWGPPVDYAVTGPRASSVTYTNQASYPLDRTMPLRFRLQQPPQIDTESRPIDHRDVTEPYPFEPIDDDEDHGLLDYEKTYPVFRNVGWIKVREAGRYLVHFQGILFAGAEWPFFTYIVDNWWIGDNVAAVGLFARKPADAGWEEIDQPAVLASRSLRTQISGTLDSGTVTGPADIIVDHEESLRESVAATAVIELGAGWAFALLAIRPEIDVYFWNWNLTCAKIGESQNPDMYWDAAAEKIDAETGWFVDPATAD